MQSAKENRRRQTWLGPLLAVVGIICVLVLIALPFTARMNELAREAEVKANLHEIQLAIERYSTDHDGSYPSYLIGGEGVTADKHFRPDGRAVFWYSRGESARASDVLIREGYMPQYPPNPFAKARDRAKSVLAMQRDVRTSITGDDPLRPGTPEAALYGTRFGADGTRMGQVLCDPRFEKWQYIDGATGAVEEHDTWAIVEYQFWDMWLDPEGREPYLPFSPGQFFYKCMGYNIVDLNVDSNLLPVPPTSADAYFLGAYGGLRSKGKDIIGEEQKFELYWKTVLDEISEKRAQVSGPVPQQGPYEYWPWTRSQTSADQKMGSPYSVFQGDIYYAGNPNGIRDSIVFALTGGDYPSEG